MVSPGLPKMLKKYASVSRTGPFPCSIDFKTSSRLMIVSAFMKPLWLKPLARSAWARAFCSPDISFKGKPLRGLGMKCQS